MSQQFLSPHPRHVPDQEHHQKPTNQDGLQSAGSAGTPPVESVIGPRFWNGHEWVPAPHLSADGKAWWDGRTWVPARSRRHQGWGTTAIVLGILTLAYCAPMSAIGIADSRGRPDYAPGLLEALYPLLLATPATAIAVTSIVLDLREKRRPLLGWLAIALAGLSAIFLWFCIFAGT